MFNIALFTIPAVQVFADRVTGQYAERRLNKFTGWVEDCLHHCDLITVYDINTEEDLDKKILLALLSGEVFNPLHVLHLSMVWDRVSELDKSSGINQNVKTTAG